MKRISLQRVKILLIALLMILTFFSFDFFYQKFSYRICHNVTDSLSQKWFVSFPINKIERGIYVTLWHPKSPHLLAKRIVGLPGDKVEIRNGIIYVEGVELGVVLTKSDSGMELRPILNQVIPQGFVFAHASHPKSFDSRYEEFGLVEITNLVEGLWPIF